MLFGVVAFNVLDVIPASEQRAVGILLTGYVFQGSLAHHSKFSERIAKRSSH